MIKKVAVVVALIISCAINNLFGAEFQRFFETTRSPGVEKITAPQTTAKEDILALERQIERENELRERQAAQRISPRSSEQVAREERAELDRRLLEYRKEESARLENVRIKRAQDFLEGIPARQPFDKERFNLIAQALVYDKETAIRKIIELYQTNENFRFSLEYDYPLNRISEAFEMRYPELDNVPNEQVLIELKTRLATPPGAKAQVKQRVRRGAYYYYE